MTTTSDKNRLTELKKIIEDKIHGSSEILIRLIDHFIKNCDDELYIKNAISLVNNRLSHFAAIKNFVNETQKVLLNKKNIELKSFLINYKIEQQSGASNIFQKHSKLLLKHKVILTISHSKTILSVLKEWRKFSSDLFVYVCESRPGMEGLETAKELKSMKIKHQIIADAMAGKIISTVDLIILGADQILRDESIVNKTGSRMLAIIAKYHKVPVFVLATEDKKIKRNKTDLPNLNFEIVEKELISKLLTD